MAFSAVISRDGTRQSVLSDVIHKLYDGSAKSLVLQVLSSQQASQADLDEIRELIEQLEQKPAAVARKKAKR